MVDLRYHENLERLTLGDMKVTTTMATCYPIAFQNFQAWPDIKPLLSKKSIISDFLVT
jgi:hypothetical protein